MIKKILLYALVCPFMLACGLAPLQQEQQEQQEQMQEPQDSASKTVANPNSSGSSTMKNLDLGAFSTSLAVKDLAASRAFYEKLGFSEVGGEPAQNWLILRNGETTVGLFQGMLPSNVMTFNPGWNSQAEPTDGFTDVREIQKRLKEAGLELMTEADESTSGPASLMLTDPDGNVILVDQHVE